MLFKAFAAWANTEMVYFHQQSMEVLLTSTRGHRTDLRNYAAYRAVQAWLGGERPHHPGGYRPMNWRHELRTAIRRLLATFVPRVYTAPRTYLIQAVEFRPASSVHSMGPYDVGRP